MQMFPATILAVLRQFQKHGNRNHARVRTKTGGRVRQLIGSANIEAQLLSGRLLEELVPLSLTRRVQYIWQQFRVRVSMHRLRRFYRLHNITYRVTSSTWRVAEEDVDDLERERREFARALDAVKRSGRPLVYFDEVSVLFDLFDLLDLFVLVARDDLS